jgi:hypothetical protein
MHQIKRITKLLLNVPDVFRLIAAATLTYFTPFISSASASASF